MLEYFAIFDVILESNDHNFARIIYPITWRDWHFLDKCISYADLLNVFEVFLPQLLLYPNPSDPLNGDAASLMMKDKAQYEQKVKGTPFSPLGIRLESFCIGKINELLHQSTASATRRSRMTRTTWVMRAMKKWATTTRRTATGEARATTKWRAVLIPRAPINLWFIILLKFKNVPMHECLLSCKIGDF